MTTGDRKERAPGNDGYDEPACEYSSPPCYLHELEPGYLEPVAPQSMDGPAVREWRREQRRRLTVLRNRMSGREGNDVARAMIGCIGRLHAWLGRQRQIIEKATEDQKPMVARYLLYISSVYVLATVSVAQQTPATNLKSIMQQLRDDTVLIMDAMLVDDMAAVADAAVRISDHPRIPPSQVSLVAAELGSEMAAFKQFDTLVHDLSEAMREAAENGDRVRTQKHFQDMIAGCMGCHSAYRPRVMSVLTNED